MLPSAKKLIGEDFIFQEDNDPKHGGEHGCKIVKKWIADNNIKRLKWPAQSPDMNPIEHVWFLLKRRLALLRHKNFEELKVNIKKEFENIDKQHISNLIKSMPRRIKALIKAKGGHTKS
jgi:transposase